jgi:glycosyltransferase involved in cell wall biosynthesis
VTTSRLTPLVTCVMPTRGRPHFVAQALEYFRRQDYPSLELVIVDDSPPDERAPLPDDDRIRVVRVPRGTSIGAKRNRACGLARGEIVVHWDDDDWYAPTRISAQVGPLLAGRADITALTTDVVLDVAPWEFWRCTPSLHRRLFVHDVHGGTLAFRRSVWKAGARYPNTSLAEDAGFLRAAVRRGARLERMSGRGLFVYVRHGRNAWRFECGRHVDPSGWLRAPEPELLARDRAFYAAAAASAGPLVSCAMLVHDRPHLIPQAVAYFLRQDYAATELVVADDAPASFGHLLPDDRRVRHVRLARRLSVGAKRNVAAEAASGELIAHWDDDDWSAPRRLSRQVEDLSGSGADVTGLRNVLFYEPATRRAWRYEWPRTGRAWVHGATMLYTKDLWRRNPFVDVDRGEDSRFLWSGRTKRVHAGGDERWYVGIVHSGNTSRKDTRHRLWRPHDVDAVETLLGADASFYAAAPARRVAGAP